jgi:hypothetical protein
MSRLQEAGYETMAEAFDAWCLDAGPDDAVTERWRRLREAGPAVSREGLEMWFAGSLEQG